MSRVPGSRRRLTTSSPPASSTRTGSAATRWRGSGRLPRDGRQPMTLLIAATGDVPTRLGELLLGRATKVAALLAAFVVERLARWMVGRVVRGLQRQGVQQRLQSSRARTPRALLATTDPLPSLRHAQRADAIGAVLRNLSSVVIWLLAAILVLQVLGVRLGPLLAGAGVVGLAIGVGAQQMVRDFLAGIAMLLDVEVARGADLALVRRTVEQAARELRRDERWRSLLLEDPEVWGVEGLGPASVTIRLAVKTRPSRSDEVARELRARVDEAIEGAEIPLPAPTEALVVGPER